MQRDKIIAIDFDGTIYDKRTKQLIPGAEIAIRELNDRGYILILWTCRNGKILENAKNILKRNGLFDCFECINENSAKMKYKTSQKVCAGYYIDDRNIGGFIGWDKVLEILR